jgi:phospholipid/cholesterol/gamma-HCH transport system permease protein
VTTGTAPGLKYETLAGGVVRLIITGKLDAERIGSLWTQIVGKVIGSKPPRVDVDARHMESCDGAGIALLQELKDQQESAGREFRIEGLRRELAELMSLFAVGPAIGPGRRSSAAVRLFEAIGGAAIDLLRDLRSQISFAGEIAVKLSRVVVHPGRIRWGDTILIAEKAGADGVAITALLGFLIGLILAFQAAIAMAMFNAQIYTANLVVIATFRELGPLITCFVLASRSGSAFAAELGTMKVNEEIDALKTMGIDPVQFLVLPRTIAAVCVVPLLTMFNNLLALAGCFVVMLAIGFAPLIVIDRIYEAAGLVDLFGGLAKTLVFGGLIAGIGCLRGLQAGTGASAVGDAATRAVVSGIVAIVIVDGMFAVVYYSLGI